MSPRPILLNRLPAAAGPARLARLRTAISSLCLGLILSSSFPLFAQPLTAGAGYLIDTQQADGSWQSSHVRAEQVTTGALRALQTVGGNSAARQAAVSFLVDSPPRDHDDGARRLMALVGEGQDPVLLRSRLLDESAAGGGWGLTTTFDADPLDSALALQALADRFPSAKGTLQEGIIALLGFQRQDGGFPCAAATESGSDLFCTSQALIALTPFRSRLVLESEIAAAIHHLHQQLNFDGSFGAAETMADTVIETAVAARVLALAGGLLDTEARTVAGFLESRQQPDGSWSGDPYPTALALRALSALHAIPYCGDGRLNLPTEVCDGSDLAGSSCESLGLGEGRLDCAADCTFDTSGCTALPVCGDNLRNQPLEVCDGSDLAAQTCLDRGFASGNLACAEDCLSYDVSSCVAAPRCGDGVINQTVEACDLSDLGGASCTSLGLGDGLLRCRPDCRFDTGACDSGSIVIDNKGREFFVGFMENHRDLAKAELHLTSDVPTEVTVEYPAVSPSFSETVDVSPGDVTVVSVPRTSHSGWRLWYKENNAIRLSGPEEFVAYLVNRDRATSDAALALPVEALGTEYLLTTYGNTPGDHSQLLVIAAFDDTTVVLRPTTLIPAPVNDSITPGEPVVVTLDRGQGFRSQPFITPNDLTGTEIEADRPIAVFQGNRCAAVPFNVFYCDHIFEMAHPVHSWGTTALASALPNRPGGSLYRVVASRDGTNLLLDGVLQTVLDRGEWIEFGPLPGNHEFSANHPIFVTQFMTGAASPGAVLGDPAMVNVIPPAQYLDAYTFSTLDAEQFDLHFLNLVAPSSAAGTVLLDGVPIAAESFSPIATSGYSAAVLPLTSGAHTTSSPVPHGITVSGYGAYDSYLYPGGARIEFLDRICGDGAIDEPFEACDGDDLGGRACTDFGFGGGSLFCTPQCEIDLSSCTGFTPEDRDNDGFTANVDCDDRDPEVHPAMPEFPDNGVDDDCNPATPDRIPPEALSCELSSDLATYRATDLIGLEGHVSNQDPVSTLTGLSARLSILGSRGTVLEEERPLAPLPPGARARLDFTTSALGRAAGFYLVQLEISSATRSLAGCTELFTIEDSAFSGDGLRGTLVLSPAKIDAGESSDAFYTVENLGNATLADLGLRVALADPESGQIVGEQNTTVTLEPEEAMSASHTFTSEGLEGNKSYLAVLLATPAGSGEELTLASSHLTVVNAPPDCSAAAADRAEIWPPNHKWTTIGIDGVTDPDGDPVTVEITAVFQDERTDALGSGDTCPDADGIGDSRVDVRAERSGRQDGRVYHLFFRADDGRGGQCEGKVLVCVPHDKKGSCGDQGPVFESGACG